MRAYTTTTLIATILAAASPSIQSPQFHGGNAVIVNQCDYPLNIWSVDQTIPFSKQVRQTVAARSNWTEPLRVPEAGCNCGVSIKISKGETPIRPILQFEYTVAEGSSKANMFQSYDISFVDCSTSTPHIAAVNGYSSFSGENCPSWDEGVKIYGTGKDCPAMNCAAGEFCPYDAYFEPEPKNLGGPQPVRQCPNGDVDSDIVLVTCAGKQVDSGYVPPAVESTPIAAPSSSSSSSSSEIPSVPSTPSLVSSSTPLPTPSSTSVVPAVPTTSSVSSVAYERPQITEAPKEIPAIENNNQHVVWHTAYVTVYVDTSGNRINEDGSKYIGRRFRA